ncbi:MAG: hypothetical protein KDB90_05180 [Planctomycetes bacterium]|nr:hypothetical protein [Planctomycetota bacterium]
MSEVSAETAYLFRHAMVREAAYQLQPPADRSGLHVLALDILESVLAQAGPVMQKIHAAELAHHARTAQEGATPAFAAELQERELGLLRIAAMHAAASWRHAEAIRHARRIQELPCATPRDHAISQSVQVVGMMYIGKYVDAVDAVARNIDLCAAIDDRDGQLIALFNACVIARQLGDMDELGRRSEELLELVQDRPNTLAHARALKARASYFTYERRHGDSAACLEPAAEILRKLDDERELSGVLLDLGNAQNALGQKDAGRATLKAAEQICLRNGDHYRLSVLHLNDARYALAAEDLPLALKAVDRAIADAGHADSSNMIGQAQHVKACILEAMGDATRASELWGQAVALLRHDCPGPISICALVRYADHLHRGGRDADARELLREARALGPVSPEEAGINELADDLAARLDLG